MRRLVAAGAAVAAASVALGCTTIHPAPALSPAVEQMIRDDHPRAELEVLVPRPDGNAQRGALVRVLPTEAIVSTSKGELQLPAASIKEVRIKNRAPSALVGAGAGLVLGLGTGFAVFYSAHRTCTNDCGSDDWGIGVLALAILGTFIGLPIGAAVGHTTVYQLGAPDDQ
jgi:hypothetical protein